METILHLLKSTEKKEKKVVGAYGYKAAAMDKTQKESIE